MNVSCETVAEQVGLLFTCSQVNQFVRIRTPLLYPDGDIIDIFLQEAGNQLILTDLGETLRWLRMQTISVRRSKKQDQMIADVTMNHNVELFRGMLIVRVTDFSELGVKVMRLAQAALRVSDLWFTLRNQAFESIADEVQEFLVENNVRYQRDDKIIGRSTRPWKVDFHTFHPVRTAFIAVLSTANSSAAQSLTNNTVAQWVDLASYKVTQDIRFVSLIDDTTDIWREHNFHQLEEYSDIVFWSQPDDLLETITT